MRTITFLSYNVKSGTLRGLDALAAAMRPVAAEIVGLQEVDRGTERSGRSNQAKELASALGLEHAVFGAATPWPGGGEYGVALLSRHPLSDVRALPLYVQEGEGVHESLREPRVLLSATVRPAGTPPIRVFVTHFGLAPEQRSVQAREAAAAAQQAAVHGPVVLMGDLNAEPEAAELAPLLRTLRDAHAGLPRAERHSFPANARQDEGITIDYVLTSTDVGVDSAEIVADAAKASDHDLCVARLNV